jgi:hypothetical protein
MTQIKKPLPDSLMKAVRAIVKSPDATAWEKVESVVLIAHGYGLFTKYDGTIDPTAYAVPKEQWSEISELLMSVSDGDAIEKVNWALTWMNVGPSSYEPEAAL